MASLRYLGVFGAAFGESGEVVFGEVEREPPGVGAGEQEQAGGDIGKAARLLKKAADCFALAVAECGGVEHGLDAGA